MLYNIRAITGEPDDEHLVANYWECSLENAQYRMRWAKDFYQKYDDAVLELRKFALPKLDQKILVKLLNSIGADVDGDIPGVMQLQQIRSTT